MTETTAVAPHPVSFLETRRLETIRGYIPNEQRTPEGLLVVTPEQTIGPFFPRRLIPDGADDLTRLAPGAPACEGEAIVLEGRVTDEAGRPVAGALVEIWQANARGKYDHPADTNTAPVDPKFRGFGQYLADAGGRYRFVTIKPGPYPNPGYDDWLRPPHVHFIVFGAGLMQHLVTQAFFPGEPLNDIDPILNGVADLEARSRLIAKRVGDGHYRFDIVLRGRQATPFFAP